MDISCSIKSKIITLFFLTFFIAATKAQTQVKAEEPFTIENYYKVKWGYAKEFIELWKKNHYPILKKAIEKGYILSVVAETPVLHSGEDTRWDFKVIIVFKNAQLAVGAPDQISPLKTELFTDLVKLEKDEQHRFELLISHWDVAVANVDLK
jgi:hypothetical protein